ncbi:MAG: Bifunctional protein FolD protein [Holosporales bacterium]
MIIDGTLIANQAIQQLKQIDHNKRVQLDVIVVGNNKASQIYVQKKRDMCAYLNITSVLHRVDENARDADLFDLIDTLNADENVNGILLQLPMSDHLNRFDIIERIAPNKDVDGITSKNLGRLMLANPHIIPCTPLGCLRLIQSVTPDLTGRHAVIVGRSELVGKPMGQLLLNHHATVTHAHSKTTNLKQITSQADILICAAGVPSLIGKDHVKNNAIVIDVGITRTQAGKVVGDVDFDDVYPIVQAITPVPGGVGPMTVACLMENTLKCAGILC